MTLEWCRNVSATGKTQTLRFQTASPHCHTAQAILQLPVWLCSSPPKQVQTFVAWMAILPCTMQFIEKTRRRFNCSYNMEQKQTRWMPEGQPLQTGHRKTGASLVQPYWLVLWNPMQTCICKTEIWTLHLLWPRVLRVAVFPWLWAQCGIGFAGWTCSCGTSVTWRGSWTQIICNLLAEPRAWNSNGTWLGILHLGTHWEVQMLLRKQIQWVCHMPQPLGE